MSTITIEIDKNKIDKALDELKPSKSQIRKAEILSSRLAVQEIVKKARGGVDEVTKGSRSVGQVRVLGGNRLWFGLSDIKAHWIPKLAPFRDGKIYFKNQVIDNVFYWNKAFFQREYPSRKAPIEVVRVDISPEFAPIIRESEKEIGDTFVNKFVEALKV